MRSAGKRSWPFVLSTVGMAALFGVAVSPVAAQETGEEATNAYTDAYLSHVERKIVALQADVFNKRILLSERAQELLVEIGLRLEDELSRLPPIAMMGDSAKLLPMPASIRRLQEYEQILSEQIYEVEATINTGMEEIAAQRDSVRDGLKPGAVALALVDEIDRAVRTDVEVWSTKVELVRTRLIADGTADQARSMFAREHNAISLHYQMGHYQYALGRFDVLVRPYGEFPLPEWLEAVAFFRAECYYALGEWDRAYQAYMTVWQQQGNLYARAATLNWTELAFAGGRYRDVATMWATAPPLPADPIDANRVRLLVAESFLRLDEPDAALAVLDRIEPERAMLPGEEEWIGEELAALQQVNTRLVIYGKLLRAEAHAAGGGIAREEDPIYAMQTTAEKQASLASLVASLTDTAGTVASPDTVSAADSLLAMGPTRLARHAESDSSRHFGRIAYLIASGQIEPHLRPRFQGDARMDSTIRDLERLVPVVSELDPGGPLKARTLLALGQAYFQRRRWGDAGLALGAMPVSSIWYPDAQIARAWALMEQERFLDARASLNLARRWPLSPPLALEAAALNTYLLTQLGSEEESIAEVRRLVGVVDLEERRAYRDRVVREIDRIASSLQFVGVIALERQSEELYRAVIAEQTLLDTLRAEVAQMDRRLEQYAIGAVDTLDPLIAAIHREQAELAAREARSTELRRQAGETPQGQLSPDLSYAERRDELQRWLSGIEPVREREMYRNWVEYAQFAYAKRVFEENQRRRTRSTELKVISGRIKRLISESP